MFLNLFIFDVFRIQTAKQLTKHDADSCTEYGNVIKVQGFRIQILKESGLKCTLNFKTNAQIA